jgi:hypothetical protein
MRMLAVLLAAVAALSYVDAAGAKLTPVEQKWAKPLITVWNQQNAALKLVLPLAAAKNALVVGTRNNLKLTNVLVVIVNCSPVIKKAGGAPSPRLSRFLGALTSACAQNTNGANAFAKAVGAVRKNKAAEARTDLTRGVAQFKLGTTSLKKAYRALISLGGANIFKA